MTTTPRPAALTIHQTAAGDWRWSLHVPRIGDVHQRITVSHWTKHAALCGARNAARAFGLALDGSWTVRAIEGVGRTG